MREYNVTNLATYLNNAELTKQEIFKITNDYPELTNEQAYDIQHEIVRIKSQSGDRVIGLKMGLTSISKMKQMGINDPLYGHLFDYMMIDDQGEISISDLIHPKAEAEIAFIMGKDLAGEDLDEETILDAIKFVVPAIEIVDSRYENFNFTLKDVIADNCSSSRLILGSRFINPKGLELDLLGATLAINNEIIDSGTGAAVLGHPLKPVIVLAKLLSKRGLKINAGSLILTGGITKAHNFREGDMVCVRIENLGEVSFKTIK